MPTVEENSTFWGATYDWSVAGEDWSNMWGTSKMQWYGMLLPRIHAFLPAHTILEIAPGFGRWTNFLKDACANLIVVDLSDKCIEACRERFARCSNISYFVNDGTSLDMIQDNSIDFIFSFDSLVHAEAPVIAAYMSQLPRKLTPNGVAFIHHSNLGHYARRLNVQRMVARVPRLFRLLKRGGAFDDLAEPWRAPSMTAESMQAFAAANGLGCISQELVTWGTRRALIDCMSIITKKGSAHFRQNRVLRNPSFMKEARYLLELSRLYAR